MAMKTVICLSFIVLNNFFCKHVSGPLLGGGGGAKGGGAPLNKTPPPKLPSIPTQTFVTLAAVSRWWLFFWKPTETSEKSRPDWRDDLFFKYQQRTW